jgi:hypothetical protein
MHRKIPISVLVYNELFPSPTPTDPTSFSAHLTKNLVGEVRIETATFYGSLDTIEARYPGLNYAHAPHRKRLGRFPHHKRLFAAFDRLGLTESEIQGFCRWEGTLWARERYERDEGVKVRDTTGMEIGDWVDRRTKEINVKTDIEVEIEEVEADDMEQQGEQHMNDRNDVHPRLADIEMQDDGAEEDDDGEESEEEESVGIELNQRLRYAAELRDRGLNEPMPTDPLWEQYVKELQERNGELTVDAARTQLSNLLAGRMAQVDRMSSPTQSPQPPPAAPA